MRIARSLALTLLAPAAALAGEPEWGSFRGPNGSGVGASARVPERLDPESNLVWRTPLAKGFSSPVLSDELVFCTSFEDERLFTSCIDRFSGELVWEKDAPAPLAGWYSGPNTPVSSTPVTDGERLWVLYPSYGLVCYDVAGEELWKQPLEPLNVPHGAATSPVLAGGKLLLQCDQDGGSFLVAFDGASGAESWRAARAGITHGYSTPAVVRRGERDEVVCMGSFRTDSYALADGKRLWWSEGMAWQTNCVPVAGTDTVFVNAHIGALSEYGAPRMGEAWEEVLAARDADGDGKIARSEWEHPGLHQIWFILDLDNDDLLDEEDWKYVLLRGRERGGLFALRLGGEGDVTESGRAWSYDDRRGLTVFTSPLLYEGVLYLIKDGGILTALDPATGKELRQDRVGEPDQYFASPIAAAGRIVLAGHSGLLSVVSAGKDWKLLSQHDLGEELWSTPAIAGGQVVVRTQEALYCFQDE